nr:hypothetical protein [uncultured Glaciecola sp.]
MISFDNEVNIETTDWYRVDGTFKRDQDWTNDSHHCFALHLVGDTSSLGDPSDVVFQEWLYVVNSSKENVEFNLPLLLNTQDWKCVL